MRGLVGLLLFFFLADCGLRGDLAGRNVSTAGAGVLFGESRGHFDLSSYSEPYDQARLSEVIASAAPSWSKAHTSTASGDPLAFEKAASSFGIGLYEPNTTTDVELQTRQNEIRDSRNEIQGFLLTISTNKCNQYKLHLRESSALATFSLGSLATGLGAVGAVFSNGTSQILSGLSGATSGINAEYNRDILSNVASAVIIPGIDKQRSALRQSIASRQCYGISSYPLSVALNDVVQYHSACSTDVGIAAASQALGQTSEAPNPTAVKAAVLASIDLHKALYGSASAKTAKKTPADAGPAAGVPQTATAVQPQPNKEPLLGSEIVLPTCGPLDRNGVQIQGLGDTK